MRTNKHKLLAVIATTILFFAPSTIPAAEQETRAQGQLPARCQEIRAMHQKMLDKIEANNRELKQLLERMNAATGQEKTEAIAQVVNQMAQQHLDMFEQMRAMHGRAMGHMAQHMHRGGMGQCPLLKEMTEGAGSPTGKE